MAHPTPEQWLTPQRNTGPDRPQYPAQVDAGYPDRVPPGWGGPASQYAASSAVRPTLLADLATITANRIQPAQGLPGFTLITTPTPIQRRAFELLGVSCRLGRP